MGVRKDYRGLTADERDGFVRALKHVKSTGLPECTRGTFPWAYIEARTSCHGTGK